MHNLHKFKNYRVPPKILMHTLYKGEILFCSHDFFHGNGPNVFQPLMSNHRSKMMAIFQDGRHFPAKTVLSPVNINVR